MERGFSDASSACWGISPRNVGLGRIASCSPGRTDTVDPSGRQISTVWFGNSVRVYSRSVVTPGSYPPRSRSNRRSLSRRRSPAGGRGASVCFRSRAREVRTRSLAVPSGIPRMHATWRYVQSSKNASRITSRCEPGGPARTRATSWTISALESAAPMSDDASRDESSRNRRASRSRPRLRRRSRPRPDLDDLRSGCRRLPSGPEAMSSGAWCCVEVVEGFGQHGFDTGTKCRVHQ